MRLNPSSGTPQIRIRLVIIVRLPFRFVEIACRDTEDIGWVILAEKFSICFRNDCEDLDFFYLKRDRPYFDRNGTFYDDNYQITQQTQDIHTILIYCCSKSDIVAASHQIA